MTWSVLCSESVLQLGMGERGLSHELVLTIRLLMVSYGMRHYESVFLVFLVLLVCLVWFCVVLVLFCCCCFFFTPVMMGAFAFLVCGFLVPKPVLGC